MHSSFGLLYMLISRKRSSLASTLPTVFIGSSEAIMEKVTSMKYLGVHISSALSWSIHIDIITSKARRTLGFIYRKFYGNVNSSVLTKLYTTLVRPLLEYCCAVWDLHLQKDIDKPESVQRLACKICTKNWSASYSDQLHFLNLPTTISQALHNVQDSEQHLLLPRKHHQLQIKVPNPPYVHSPCVCKLFAYSAHLHKLIYELLCSEYLNSMEWPPPCHHLFVYTHKNYLKHLCLVK